MLVVENVSSIIVIDLFQPAFRPNPRFEFEAARQQKLAGASKGDALESSNDKGAVGDRTWSQNVTDKAHIFYYPWYGNPQFDGGKYYHWNHKYLQHWDKNTAARWPKGLCSLDAASLQK